jgi:hypothetical protein
MERYWQGGQWVYEEAEEPEPDLGPDLIDWLEEVREDWRAGIPALLASLRLALTAALGALQGGSGWDTLLTIRTVLVIGLWRVFMALAVIAYCFTMFAVFDAVFLEPVGLGILAR